MQRFSASVILEFPEKFCSHPYWPELEELINIQKSSGMNRARTAVKREQALAEYLKRNGWTSEQYKELEKLAHRQWYTSASKEIIIPSHQFYGCLIESAQNISASQRPCDPDSMRHLLRLSSEWPTGKKQADGIYRRLVMPKSGSGQPLSNQRGLRENEYIESFSITGTMSWYENDLHHADELPDFLGWAGQRIGIGACRKMGFGRFLVKEFIVGSS